MGTTDTSSRLDRQLKNFLKKLRTLLETASPVSLKIIY